MRVVRKNPFAKLIANFLIFSLLISLSGFMTPLVTEAATAPVLISKDVTTQGDVSLTFDQTMVASYASGTEGQFTVLVDNMAVAVTGVTRTTTITKIKLTLATKVLGGQTVTVAYSKSDDINLQVKTADGGVLESFEAQNVTNSLVVSTPPVLTADTTANTVGLAIDLTYADNAVWRGRITDITVNGTSIAGNYTVAAGTITIDAGVFTTAGDYAIVVKAAGYTDATVTQTMNAPTINTPPALTADTTNNTVGQAAELTFTDDTAWTGAITDITVNGTSIAGSYTVATGTITINAGVFVTAGDYAIVVKAGGYADAAVTQTMNAPTINTPPVLTADTTNNTVGQAAELTFTDDAAWIGAITDITVNGTSIAGSYTVAAGTITINAGVFVTAGDYAVAVKATGYADGVVIQTMTAAASITTVAGNGTSGFTGDGGPATAANVNFNNSRLAVDNAGNIFISDSSNCRIRMVAAVTGMHYGVYCLAGNICTVAGNGTNSSFGNGVPALSAGISAPRGMTVDGAGNLYIADMGANWIRKVTPSGIITTVAGGGGSGQTADGLPATSAQLRIPLDVAVDSAGNIFIADSQGNSNKVRMVPAASGTYYGIVMTAGCIYTVAGNGTAGYSGDGGSGNLAQLNTPSGVAVDSTGNIYIADSLNNCVRKVNPSGIISTLAGTGNGTAGYSGDGGAAVSAQLKAPTDLSLDKAGNLYIADTSNYRLRRVDPVGIITTVAGIGTSGFAGDGGPAIAAQISNLNDVALDTSGNLYIADNSNNRVRKVGRVAGTAPALSALSLSGSAALSYSGPSFTYDLANLTLSGIDQYGESYNLSGAPLAWTVYSGPASISGSIMTVNYWGTVQVTATAYGVTSNILDLPVDGSRALGTLTLSGSPVLNFSGASFTYNLTDLTLTGLDRSGSVYDLTGWPVTWAVSSGPATVSGSTLTIYGSGAVDVTTQVLGVTSNVLSFTVANAGLTAGNIATMAGIGTMGYTGNGGPAVIAQIKQPRGVAVDSSGNVYISEYGNHIIRKVDGNGNITTVVGTGAGSYSGDNGPATAATIKNPAGIVLDGSGNLYIADYGNHRIRKVDTSGIITTVAGTGSTTYNGDNIAAISANLYQPAGVAVDSAGNIYIADYSNNRIRMVPATTGIYYGISMTALNIYTVAGTGTASSTGDSGAATLATINRPSGVDVDSSGNLYIGEYTGNRIRMVNTSGIISTVAGTGTASSTGDDGAATSATINKAAGVKVDASGNLYIAEYTGQKIRKVVIGGNISTVAGNGSGGYSGDGGAATAASINGPYNVALDSKGNMYIADYSNHRVRFVKLASDPVPTLNADTTGNVIGQPADLTFIDDATWRSRITDITVNGTSITDYTVVAGMITLNPGVFTTVGDYAIVVKATGYADATITQIMNAPAAAPVPAGGEVTAQGDVSLTFDKAMADPTGIGAEGQFTILVDGRNVAVNSVVKTSTATKIKLVLAAKVLGGQSVTAAYSKSTETNKQVKAADGGVLESFGAMNVTNNLPLLTPPVLNYDITANFVGQAIELTFIDSAAWRAEIKGVSVDGTALAVDKYAVSAGKITIAADVFTEVKDFAIVITATGYTNAIVTQTISNPSPVYTVSPAADPAITAGKTPDGIATLTVMTGYTGLVYFEVNLAAVIPHEGNETVVFTHTRNGSQLGISAGKADFDQIHSAIAGFNVQAGDVVKVYIVDNLTNDVNVNPIIFQ